MLEGTCAISDMDQIEGSNISGIQPDQDYEGWSIRNVNMDEIDFDNMEQEDLMLEGDSQSQIISSVKKNRMNFYQNYIRILILIMKYLIFQIK